MAFWKALPSRACLFKGHDQRAECLQLELGDIGWGRKLRGNQEESAEASWIAESKVKGEGGL